MKARTKIHVATAAIIALTLVTALLLGRTFVLRKFLDVENIWITQNLTRARNAVTDEIAKIDSHTKEWGWWNATYDFMRNAGADFINNNLGATSLIALDINYIFFINSQNSLVHSAGVDPIKGKIAQVPDGLIQAIAMKAPIFIPTNSKGGVSGIKAYPPYGIFLIASRHILDSDASGPSGGTIIMMRQIDDMVMRKWEKLVQRNIEVYARDDPMLPAEVAAAFTNGDPRAKPVLLRPDQKTIQGYSILNDITGRPTVAVMVEGPRTVWAYARTASLYLLVTLVLLAILSFATSTLVLRRKVFVHAAEVDDEELRHSELALKKSNEDLERLNRDRAEFTSMISHELRNPLGTIQQSIEILLDGIHGPLNEDQTERLTVAHRNVDRLIKLANDILDLTRLDTGRIRLAFADADMGGLLDEATGLMKPQAERKGVEISVSKPEMSPHATCDAGRIEQTIVNLISNAIKATEAGGRITLKLSDAGSDVRIDVEDTGKGIEDEYIPELFEPFSKVRKRGLRTAEGTGLGLSICKHIVDAHGGRIDVASELGAGSTFTIFIPKAGPGKDA